MTQQSYRCGTEVLNVAEDLAAKEKTYERGKNVLGLKQKPCFHPTALRLTEEEFAVNGWAAAEQMTQMQAVCDKACTKYVCPDPEHDKRRHGSVNL